MKTSGHLRKALLQMYITCCSPSKQTFINNTKTLFYMFNKTTDRNRWESSKILYNYHIVLSSIQILHLADVRTKRSSVAYITPETFYTFFIWHIINFCLYYSEYLNNLRMQFVGFLISKCYNYMLLKQKICMVK